MGSWVSMFGPKYTLCMGIRRPCCLGWPSSGSVGIEAMKVGSRTKEIHLGELGKVCMQRLAIKFP